MDISFSCEHCGQELEVDSTAAGSMVECPSCAREIQIPEPATTGIAVAPPRAPEPPKEAPKFVVPQRETPAEALISKPNKPLEVAAKEDERKLRVKTFRHSDYVELGGDHFDEEVSRFLQLVGQDNLIKIDHISYSAKDPDGNFFPDYGIFIVFRG